MATCGRCKQTGQTVSHIRACYLGSTTTTATTATPKPRNGNEWDDVNHLRSLVAPHLHKKGQACYGRFAVRMIDEGGSEVTKFYRVKQWNGRTYVDVQASDDLYPVKRPAALKMILSAIVADPEGSARLYGRALGECSRCGRTLTDETSRAYGMGPECRSK